MNCSLFKVASSHSNAAIIVADRGWHTSKASSPKESPALSRVILFEILNNNEVFLVFIYRSASLPFSCSSWSKRKLNETIRLTVKRASSRFHTSCDWELYRWLGGRRPHASHRLSWSQWSSPARWRELPRCMPSCRTWKWAHLATWMSRRSPRSCSCNRERAWRARMS